MFKTTFKQDQVSLSTLEIGGCREPCQPFANPSPTFRQPLSKSIFLSAPGTRLETQVNGFLARAGKRGQYERGLFTGGISGISKFSRFSRKWSDSPLFSTVWGFSRISKFSRISREWTFLKRPLFQKTPFPKDPFFRTRFLARMFWNDDYVTCWQEDVRQASQESEPPNLERGRGVMERGGTVLRTSQHFSALSWPFRIRNLILKISENPLKISENLSELFGPLPLCPLPLYLSTTSNMM